MSKRIHLASLVVGLFILALVGCIQLQNIVVTPAAVILDAGESVAFTAMSQLGSTVAATWAVDTGPGSITSAGVYTAPATVSEVTNAVIIATRVDDPNATGSAVVTIRPPISAGVVDALGDTFGTDTYDVTSIRTSRTSTTLMVSVAFDPAMPPALPQSGSIVAAGELAGFIDFDVDESRATGVDSANSTFCPCTPISAIGSDFFVCLFARNAAGNYDIIDSGTLSDVGDAIPKLEGNVLILTISLADLEADDGATNVNCVVGDRVGPSDCVPDEGSAMATRQPSSKRIEVSPEEYLHLYFIWTRYGILWTQTDSFSI